VKKFGEVDLEFHVLDALDVWQARDVVEERRCGPAADLLMDLKSCSAAELLGLQYECSGDGPIALEGFGEKGDGHWGAPWAAPGDGSRCVCKGGNEICGRGAFLEVFAIGAVG
jgi:hypothetical protein